jgi:small subunit ribosomal protein S9
MVNEIKKSVLVVGKRKTCIARVVVKLGSGIIRINNESLDSYFSNENIKLRVKEPLLISNSIGKYDILVNVKGSGFSSQADAIRQAIAKGICEITQDFSLKEKFLSYDKALIVPDVRFKESHKPNSSKSARSKRQKSYR